MADATPPRGGRLNQRVDEDVGDDDADIPGEPWAAAAASQDVRVYPASSSSADMMDSQGNYLPAEEEEGEDHVISTSDRDVVSSDGGGGGGTRADRMRRSWAARRQPQTIAEERAANAQRRTRTLTRAFSLDSGVCGVARRESLGQTGNWPDRCMIKAPSPAEDERNREQLQYTRPGPANGHEGRRVKAQSPAEDERNREQLEDTFARRAGPVEECIMKEQRSSSEGGKFRYILAGSANSSEECIWKVRSVCDEGQSTDELQYTLSRPVGRPDECILKAQALTAEGKTRGSCNGHFPNSPPGDLHTQGDAEEQKNKGALRKSKLLSSPTNGSVVPVVSDRAATVGAPPSDHNIRELSHDPARQSDKTRYITVVDDGVVDGGGGGGDHVVGCGCRPGGGRRLERSASCSPCCLSSCSICSCDVPPRPVRNFCTNLFRHGSCSCREPSDDSDVIIDDSDIFMEEETLRKRCLGAFLNFVYVLLAFIAVIVTYSMVQDLITAMNNPVRSIHYKKLQDYEAPGISMYPGGAKFLACGHYYNNVVTSKVRTSDLDLVNKNCTFTRLNYDDPHYRGVRRDVLVVRGPTSFAKREAIFLHFELEDETRDFFTVSYFVFPGWDQFNASTVPQQIDQLTEYHRYMPTFALSSGLRMWIKLIMSETYLMDDTKHTEFRVEYSVVKFWDRRPEGQRKKHLFFIFFEWKNNIVEQSYLIYTTTPWSIGAGLCGVFLTLHRGYQLAQTGYKRARKDKQRRSIRKRTLRELKKAKSMEKRDGGSGSSVMNRKLRQQLSG